MITLAQAAQNIDRGVVYTPRGGGAPEDGTIVRVSGEYIMVRYAGQVKATDPEDLDFFLPGSRVCPACNAQPHEPCTQPTDFGRREVAWYHLARKEPS